MSGAVAQVLTLISMLYGGAAAADCSGTETAMAMIKGADLSGQTHVITGGDSGLGYETGLALASAKAKVILACRSTTKCPEAAANMTRMTGNKDVVVIPLDLSSFDSVRRCAAAIRQSVPRLDVLINNAGLLANPKGLAAQTDDGFDRVYQVNFLSGHLLIRELLPLLRSSNGRVINVASISSHFPCAWGHYLPGCTSLGKLPKFAKTSPFGPNLVGTPASNYGMTKWLDIFNTAELAHREPNITAVSLHPGIVSTDMVGGLSWLTLKIWCLDDGHKTCPRTVQQGASTQTYLAFAPKAEVQSGKYYDSCMVHDSVRDDYVKQYGESEELTYQSAIFDMANGFIGTSGSVSNAVNGVFV